MPSYCAQVCGQGWGGMEGECNNPNTERNLDKSYIAIHRSY